MGRFISGSSSVEQSYSRAEVFSTPGTATWSVPAGVSKAKVFVIGAGSNYRSTEFCFESSSACCSGVDTPGTEYCLNFIGHLVGAGGGYAEKTLDGVAPGSSMTINVGSVGGLSASSVSIGGTTVTANNATDSSISWNCAGNSTARDNSNDNLVSLGFDLPVCGYRNCINGYFNAGGTAAGGDVNRTGGAGVFIPFFREDSVVDGTLTATGTGGASSGPGEGCTCTQWTGSGYDYTFGGRRYHCTCTIAYLKPSQGLNGNQCGCCFYWGGETNFNCLCLVTYHNVFGGRCYSNMPWSQCICQRMCNGVYLCVNGGGGGGGAAGVTNFAKSGGSGAGGQMYPASDDTFQVTNCPVGIGAEAGSSHADGYQGVSDATLLAPEVSAGGGGGGGSSDTVVCYVGFGQDHFSFIYGNSACGSCAAMENLYGSSGGSLYYTLGYSKDAESRKPSSNSIIPLSTLKSRDGTNVADFKFGFGATSNEAAGPGGGGNRLYPTGGSGAVVVVY